MLLGSAVFHYMPLARLHSNVLGLLLGLDNVLAPWCSLLCTASHKELLLLVSGHHLSHNLFSFGLPLIPISCGIVQTLITGNTKDIALFQFLGKGNNVIVKEPKLSFVPEFCRILVCSSTLKCRVHLFK